MLCAKKSYFMILLLVLSFITPLTVIPVNAQASLQAVDRYPQTLVYSNEPVYYFVQASGNGNLTLEAVMNITLDTGLVVDTTEIVPHGTCNLNVRVVFPNDTDVAHAFVRIHKAGIGIVGAGYTDQWGFITFYIWGGAYYVQAYYDADNDGVFDYYGNLSIPFFNKGAVVKVTLYPVKETLGIHGASYKITFNQKMFRLGANWYMGVIPGLPSLYTVVKASDPTMPGDLRVIVKSSVQVNIKTSSGETLYTTTYNVQPSNYTDKLKPIVLLLDENYGVVDDIKLVDAPSNTSLKILAFDDWSLDKIRAYAYNDASNISLSLKKDKITSNLEIALSKIQDVIHSIEASLGNYTITIPAPSIPLKVYNTIVPISKPGETIRVKAVAVDAGGRESISQIAVLMGVNNKSDIIVVDPLFKYTNYIVNENTYAGIGSLLASMGIAGLSDYYNGLASLGKEYHSYKNLLYNYTGVIEKYKPYIVSRLPDPSLLDKVKPKAIVITTPLISESQDKVEAIINYAASHNITIVLTPQALLDPAIIGGDRTVFYTLLQSSGLVDYYVAARILSQVYPNTLLSIPWIEWTGPLTLADGEIVYAVNSTIQAGWQLGYAGMSNSLKNLLSLNISLDYYNLLASQLGIDATKLVEKAGESLDGLSGVYESLANATYIGGKLVVNGVEVPVSSELIKMLVDKPRAKIIARSNDNLAIATRYDVGGLHVIYTGVAPRDLGLIVKLLDQKSKTYTTTAMLQGIRVSEEVVEEYQSIMPSLVNYTKLLVNDTIIVPCNGYAIYNISDLKKGEVAVTVISEEGIPEVIVNSDGLVLGEHNGKVYNTIIANASKITLNISVDNPNSMLVPVKIIVRAKPLKPKPVVVETKGIALQLEYNKTAYRLLGSPDEITVSLKKEDLIGVSKLIVPLNTLPSRKIVLNLTSIIRNDRIDRSLDIVLVDDVGNMTLKISKDTNISTGTLEFKPMKIPPALPENSYVIAPVVDIGPSGIVFNKPVTIEVTYNKESIQMLETSNNTIVNLSIAYYDYNNNTWIKIPTIVKDNYAIANTTHFTPYTLIATVTKINQTTNNTNNNTMTPVNNTTTTMPINTSTTTTQTATTTTTTTTSTTQTTTTTTSPTTSTTTTTTQTTTPTTSTPTKTTITSSPTTTTTTKTTTSKTATVTPITNTSTQQTKTNTRVQQTSNNVITLPFIGLKLGETEALILGSLILAAVILLIAAAIKRR